MIEDEPAIIAAALSGNQKAYTRLVEAHRTAVFHIVNRIVHNDEATRDLVQETFMKAFASLGSYRSEFRFSTWLYKIAANSSIDHLRKKRIHALSLDAPVETRDGQIEIEVPDETHNPELQLLRSNASRSCGPSSRCRLNTVKLSCSGTMTINRTRK